MDNYLKAIFEIAGGGGRASTTEVARKLGVAAASVTGMLRKLAVRTPALVLYEKRRGAQLTMEGKRRAVEVIRHHRLIESFLHQALGYGWHEVHDEAERLEHFISEDFEARVDAHLGHPEFDPHGHPIPRKDGSIPGCEDAPLAAVAAGTEVRVSRVSDEDPDVLRMLARHGVKPNVVLRIVERHQPDEGTLLERWPGEFFTVSAAVAARIAVVVLAGELSQR